MIFKKCFHYLYIIISTGLAIGSLPCVKGGAEERGGGIVKNQKSFRQSLSQLRWQLPLHKGAYRCGGITQKSPHRKSFSILGGYQFWISIGLYLTYHNAYIYKFDTIKL